MPVFVGRKLEFSPHEHPVTVMGGSRAYDLKEVGEEYTVYRTTHSARLIDTGFIHSTLELK